MEKFLGCGNAIEVVHLKALYVIAVVKMEKYRCDRSPRRR